MKKASRRRKPKKFARVRLHMELLEDRNLLDHGLVNAVITSQQRDNLLAGLRGLADWGQSLGNHRELAQPFALVDESLGRALDVRGALRQGLADQVTRYFDQNPGGPHTTDELVAFLQGVSGTYGSYQVVVDPASVVGGGTQDPHPAELQFVLNFTAYRTTPAPLNLGSNAAAYGVSLDPASRVPLTSALSLDFTFGLDLKAAQTPPQSFFVRGTSAAMSGQVFLADLAFNARVGFLEATVPYGYLVLDASAGIGLASQHADGTITLGELQTTPLQQLVSLTPRGTLDAAFAFQVQFGDFVPAGFPTLTFSSAAVFSGAPPTVQAQDFADLRALTHVNAGTLLDQFDRFAVWLGRLADAGALRHGVPFVQDRVVGRLFDVSRALRTRLLDRLRSGGQPTFGTAQELARQLNTLLQLPAGFLTENYDPATGDLTFHVRITDTFAQTGQLTLNVNAGDLSQASSTSPVGVGGTVLLDFTFGYNLRTETPPDDRFFVSGFVAGLDLRLTGTLDANARLGFLEMRSTNATISGNATAVFWLKDPSTGVIGARLPLGRLLTTPADDVVELTALDGTAELRLTRLTFPGLTVGSTGGDPAVTVVVPYFFDLSNAQVTYANFANLRDFATLDSPTLAGLLVELSAALGNLRESSLFNGPIPFVGALTWRNLFDFESGYLSRLIGFPPFTSARELAAGLATAFGMTLGDVDARYDVVRRELTYQVSFEELFDTLLPLALNVNPRSLSDLRAEALVALRGSYRTRFTVGMQLSPLGPGETLHDKFFVRGFTVDGRVQVGSDPFTLAGRMGFLEFTDTEATVRDDVTPNFTMRDPNSGQVGGRVTLAELFRYLPGDPARLVNGPALRGTAELLMPRVQFNNFDVGDTGGQPAVTWSVPTLTDPTSAQLTLTNFGNLTDFLNVQPADVTAMLDHLAGSLTQFRNLPGFAAPVPFAQGRTFSDLFDFGPAFRVRQGRLGAFHSAQTLAVELARAFGMDLASLDGHYDPASREFTYRLAFEGIFDTTVPLAFNVNMRDLTGLLGVTQATLRARYRLEFQFGANLTPPQAGQTLPDRFLLRGAAASGEVHVAGTTLRVEAHLGFLQFLTLEGGVRTDGTLGFTLKDPATGQVGGRVTLAQLRTALAGDPNTILDGPPLRGSAELRLPNLQFLGFNLGSSSGPPGLTLTVPLVSNPSATQLEFQNFGTLGDFVHVRPADMGSMLDHLQGSLALLRNLPAFAAPVPFVARTFADVLDLGQALRTRLSRLDSFSSAQQLITELARAFGLTPAAIDGRYDRVTRELTYRLAFEDTFDVTLPLAFNVNVRELSGIRGGATVTLRGRVRLEFTLGVHLMPPQEGQTLQDRFFVRGATADGEVRVASTATGRMEGHLGFLQYFSTEGSVRTDGTLGFTLKNPSTGEVGGRVTLAQLRANLPGNPDRVLNGPPLRGTAELRLPRVQFHNFQVGAAGGEPSVTLALASMTDGTATQLTFTNLPNLTDFVNVRAADVVPMLDHLAASLTLLRNAPAFAAAIPFVQGRTYGDLFDFGTPFRTRIGQVGAFTSAQELASSLAAAFGLTLTAVDGRYDPARRELTYHLIFDATFATTANLAFNVNLRDVYGLRGVTVVNVQGRYQLDVRFGVKLAPPQPGETLHDRFLVRNAAASGEVHVAGTSLRVEAQVGFLQFVSTAASVRTDGTLAFTLRTPVTGEVGGAVTLAQFRAALPENFERLLTPPMLRGNAELRLPGVRFLDFALGNPPPSAAITATVPVITDPAATEVVYTDFGNLTNFRNVSASQMGELVTSVAEAVTRFQGDAIFGQPVPFAQGQTYALAFDFLRTVQTRLGRLSFTSAQELAAALARDFGLTGDRLTARYDPATGELAYRVVLEQPFTVQTPLGGNVALGSLGGLSSATQVTMSGLLNLTFTLGVRLSGTGAVADRLFVRDFSASGEVRVTGDSLAVSGRLGLLQIQSGGSSVRTDATVGFGLRGPGETAGGTLTLAQLRTGLVIHFATIANLPIVRGTAQLVLRNLQVPGNLVMLPAGAQLTAALPDLRDLGTVVLTPVNTGALMDFGTGRAADLAGLTNSLSEAVGRVRSQPVFGLALPFAQGHTYGTAFSFLQDIQTRLGRLTFNSAQELTTALAQEFGLTGSNLVVGYNTARQELTYRLVLDRAFASQVPLGFNVAFDELTDLRGTATAALSGRLNLTFTFGMRLSTGQSEAERLFVRDFVAAGEVHVLGQGLSVTGQLGLVPLQSTGSSVRTDGVLRLGLREPGFSSAGGTVTLTQLRDALALNFAAVAELPTVQGTAELAMRNLRAPEEIVRLPANARLTAVLPMLMDPGTTRLVPEDAGDLMDFAFIRASNLAELLGTLSSVLGRFRAQPLFGQAVPLVQGLTYGDVFGFLQTVETRLGRLTFASARDIVPTLAREFGIPESAITVRLDGERRELTYRLPLEQTFSLRPALAAAFGDLNGMTADAIVTLAGRMNFAFTFGIRLGGGQALADRLFVRDFAASGEVHLTGPALRVLGRLGLLQVESTGSSVRLDGTVAFGLREPGGQAGGTVTLAQMRNALTTGFGTIAALPTLWGDAQLVLQNVRVPASLLTLPDGARVTLDLPNLQDLGTLRVTGFNTTVLLDFLGSRAGDLAGLVSTLGDVAGRFRSHPTFGLAVPFAQGQTLGGVLNLLQTMQTRIGQLTFASAQELTTALAREFGLSGANLMARYDAARRELTYRVVLEQTVNTRVPLALAASLGGLTGLSGSATVVLTGRLNVTFTFGMKMVGDEAVGSRLFARDFTAGGEFRLAGQDMRIDARLGMLQLTSTGSTVQDDGTLTFGLREAGRTTAGGTVTLDQMRAALAGDFRTVTVLPTLAGSAQLVLQNLSVPGGFLTLPPGNPRILVTLPDLRAPENVQVRAENAGSLLDLRDIQTADMAGLVGTLADVLGRFRAQPVFGRDVPFVQGRTLGDAFDFLETIQTRLARLTFGSLQELSAALAREFGLTGSSLVVRYDAATSELTYRVVLDQPFNLRLPLAFNVHTGDLNRLTSTAQVTLSGRLNLTFTLGMALGGDRPVTSRLFVRDLTGSGEFHVAAQDLAIAARLGALQLDSAGSSVRSDGTLTFALREAVAGGGTTLTLAQIRNALNANNLPAVAALPALRGDAQLRLQNLRVRGDFVTLPPGNPRVTVMVPDLLAPNVIEVTPENVGDLLGFAGPSVNDLAGLMGTLADVVGRFRNQPLFGQALPFIQGQTYGPLADFLQTLQTGLGRLTFGSAQDLGTQLAREFNLSGDDLVVRYDAGQRELTYRLVLTRSFSARVPLSVGGGLGDLTGLNGDQLADLAGRLNVTFTFGLKTDSVLPVAERLFVRDFGATGTVTLVGPSQRLAARLGFLQLDGTGGVRVDGGLTFGLRQPGRLEGGTLSLAQLREVLADGFASVANLPVATGQGQLVLQNIQVRDNLLPAPNPNARLTVRVADLQRPAVAQVLPEDLGYLPDFGPARSSHFTDLVSALNSTLALFREQPVFRQPLPLAQGRTLGDVFDFVQVVQTRLGRLTFASAQELTAGLFREFGQLATALETRFDPVRGELTYRLVLEQAFSTRVPLALNLPLSDLTGLTSDGMATLTGRVVLGFTFGVKLIGGQALGDRLFVRDLSADGEVRLAGQDLRVAARLGILQLESSGSGVRLDGTLAFGLKELDSSRPGGTVSLTQMRTALAGGDFTRIATLPVLRGTAELNLHNLFVPDNLLTLPGPNPRMRVALPDLRNLGQVELSADGVGALLNFRHVRAAHMTDLLTTLAGVLTRLREQPAFGRALPFVPNRTFGNVLELFQTAPGSLNRLTFATAQELLARLAREFGATVQALTASYDPTRLELTFRTVLEQPFRTTLPLVADQTLGDVSGLGGSAQVTLTGRSTLIFTFGVKLDALTGGQTIADKLFVRDLAGGGEVRVAAGDMRLAAHLGLLRLESSGSTLLSDTDLALGLVEPGRISGGTLLLPQLRTALNSPTLAGLANLPALRGGGTLALQNLRVPDNLFTLPGSTARLLVTLPDVNAPANVQLTAENAGSLLDFRTSRPAHLTDLLGGVAGTLGQFHRQPVFAAALPFVPGRTLGQVFDYLGTIQDRLARLAPTSAQDLTARLIREFGLTVGENLLTQYDPVRQELTYTLLLHQSFRSSLPLDHPGYLNDLGGITGESPLALQGYLAVALTLGYKVAGTQPLAERLFVRDLQARGEARLGAESISISARLGFLQLLSSGSAIQAENFLTFALNEPGRTEGGGTLTLAQLRHAQTTGNLAPIASLPSVRGGAFVQLENIRVADNFTTQPSASARLTVTLSDPLNPATADLIAQNLGPALDFRTLRPAHMADLVANLAAALGRLRGHATFSRPFPLAMTRTVGQVFGFLETAQTRLAGLQFRSAQELTARLAQAFDLYGADLVAAYDPVEQVLTYRVVLERAIRERVPLSFVGDLGDITALRSDDQIELVGRLNVAFVLGASLTPRTGSQTIQDKLFLFDVLGRGEVRVQAGALNVTGSLGFVGLESSGSTVQINSTLDFALNEPGRGPGGKVTLTQLRDGLAGDFTRIATLPALRGDARLTLENLRVQDSLIPPGAQPRVLIVIPNVANPASAQVFPEDMGALEYFYKLRTHHLASLMSETARVLDRFRTSYPVFGQPVPFAQHLRFDDVFNLVRRLQTALATLPFTSAQDLAGELVRALGVAPDSVVGQYHAASRELTWTVNLNVPFRVPVPLSVLGTLSHLLRLTGEQTVEMTGRVQVTFSFGIKLPIPRDFFNDQLFLRDLRVSGEYHMLTEGLDAQVRVGFLSLLASAGVRADGTFLFGLKDPATGQLFNVHLSLNQLRNHLNGTGNPPRRWEEIAVAPVLTGNAQMVLTRLRVPDGVIGLPANARITYAVPDLMRAADIQFRPENTGRVADFLNATPAQAAALFTTLADVVDLFRVHPEVTRTLPFAQRRFTDVLGFFHTMPGRLRQFSGQFTTAQELTAALRLALGGSLRSLVASYDGTLLTYRVELAEDFRTTAPLAFNVPMGNFSNLQGEATVDIHGRVTLRFTLGFKLLGTEPVHERLSIRGFAAQGEAHLTAESMRLAARLGLLGVTSTGSSVRTDAFLNFSLRDSFQRQEEYVARDFWYWGDGSEMGHAPEYFLYERTQICTPQGCNTYNPGWVTSLTNWVPNGWRPVYEPYLVGGRQVGIRWVRNQLGVGTWYGNHHVLEYAWRAVTYQTNLAHLIDAVRRSDLRELALLPIVTGRAEFQLREVRANADFVSLPPGSGVQVSVPDLLHPEIVRVTSNPQALADLANGQAVHLGEMLTTLGALLDRFRTQPLFGQALPFAGGQTYGSTFDYLALVLTRLGRVGSGSAQEVAARLAEEFATVGGTLVAGYDPVRRELTYRLVLEQNFSRRVPLGFNVSFSDLGGLDGSAEVTVHGRLRLTVTMGMALAGSQAPADRLFFRDLVADGEAHVAAADLALAARFGFLQITSAGASARTDGTLAFGLLGQKSVTQVRTALNSGNLGGIANLPVFSGRAELVLPALRVGNDFLSLPANARLTVTLADLRNPANVVVTPENVGLLPDFAPVRAGQFGELLTAVSTALGRFRSAAFLSQPLPFVPGRSVSDAFDYVRAIQTRIGSLRFNTAQELAAALAQEFGLTGANLVVGYDAGRRELTYRLVLRQTFNERVRLGNNLNLGDLAALTTDTPVTLSGWVNLAFTFGMRLTGPGAVTDRLFVRDFDATGEVHLLGETLSVVAPLGFLSLESRTADVRMDGTLSFGLKQPGSSSGGTVTLTQLLTGLAGNFETVANLAALRGNAQLQLPNLRATGDLVTLPANARIIVRVADLGDPARASVTQENLGSLSDFSAVRAGGFADLLTAVAGSLQQFRTHAAFANPLPFAPGKTFADVFDFLPAAQARLGRLTFATAQELAAALAREFGLTGDALIVRYDAARGELTYQVRLGQAFSTRLPLGFNLALGDLAGLTGDNVLTATGRVEMRFTFGLRFGPQPLAERLFVRDFFADGEVHLLADAVRLSARLGFLQLQTGGSARSDGTLTFGLRQPGQGSGGTVTLAQLREALAGDFRTVANLPVLRGNAVLTLDNLFVPGGVLEQPGPTARIIVTAADFTNLAAAQAAYQNLGAVELFRNVRSDHFAELVNAVATALGHFRGHPLFNQPLPFADGKTLGDVFDFLNTARTRFSRLSFNSAQDLAAQLGREFGLSADALQVRYDAARQEFTYRLVLDQAFNVRVPLGFFANLGDLDGLSGQSQVSLSGRLGMTFTFGMRLTGTGTPQDRLFVRDFSGTGEVHLAGDNITMTGRLGVLQLLLEASGTSVRTDGTLTFGLREPGQSSGGTLTVTQLGQAATADRLDDLSNLPRLRGTAVLNLQRLRVQGDFLPQLPANARITVTLPDLEKPNRVDLTPENVGNLMNFARLRATDLGELLKGVAGALERFRADPVFARVVPFAQGKTLGDVFAFLDVARNRLTRLSFTTVQELAVRLARDFGLSDGTFRVQYDAAGQELSYRITLTQPFSLRTPVGFNVGLGELAGMESTALVLMSGEVALGFTFGVRLAGTEPVEQRLFVRDFTARGDVRVAGQDLRVVGRLGLLRLVGTGSRVQTTQAVTFGLRTAAGSVTLAQLGNALRNGGDGSFPSLANLPAVTGSAELLWQNLQVPDDFVRLPAGNPRLVVTLPQLANPSEVVLAGLEVGTLLDFRALVFADVRTALLNFKAYLNAASGVSYLANRLPVLNKGIREVFDYPALVGANIDRFLADPPEDLQAMARRLRSAFGLFPDDTRITVTYTTDRVLRLDVTFSQTDNRLMPVNLALGTFGVTALNGLDNFTSGGDNPDRLSVQHQLNLGLRLGLDLSRADRLAFLYDQSTLAVNSFILGGSSLRGIWNLGPIYMYVAPDPVFGAPYIVLNRDGNPATATPAEFRAALRPRADGRYPLAGLAGQAGTVTDVSLLGQADVRLPLFYPTEGNPLDGRNNNLFQLRITDLRNVTGSLQPRVPDLRGALFAGNVFARAPMIVPGVDRLFTDLQNALVSKVFAYVPLVGGNLTPVIRFFAQMRERVMTEFLRYSEANRTMENLRYALFVALGPLGLNLLQGDSERGVFPEDVGLESSSRHFQYNMRLAQALTVDLPTGFDLGLPAVGFSMAARVRVQFSWSLRLGIGYHQVNGFYLDTSVRNPLQANLTLTVPGLSGPARLLWLRLNAADSATSPTRLVGQFAVDFRGRESLDKLTFNDLTRPGLDLGQVVRGRLDGNLNLNFGLRVDMDGGFFPSVLADFGVRWGFAGADTAAPRSSFGNRPGLTFDNVRLDMGSLFNFLRSVMGRVRQVLDPIMPILDVINRRLPVISDVARRDVTLLDVARQFAPGADFRFLDVLRTLHSLTGSLPVASGPLMLGSFDLGAFDVRSALSLAESVINQTITVPGWANQLSGTVRSYFATMTSTIGLALPILQEPQTAFAVLLGKDIPLVSFETPTLRAGFHMEQNFLIFSVLGIINLWGKVYGGVDLSAKIKVGYDTYGLRRALQTGDLALVADGFFIDTRATFVSVTGRIGVGAYIDIWVARAGVNGEIGATFTVRFVDPGDGRLHGSQISQIVSQQGVGGLFRANGEIFVGLYGYFETLFVKVRVYKFGISISFGYNRSIVFSFRYTLYRF